VGSAEWKKSGPRHRLVDDMKHENLKNRTKRFALDVIHFVEGLPLGETCRVIGRQLLRAGTSVGANYRAACRARSKPDFISKMGVVEEEADECACWIELLVDDAKVSAPQAVPLLREAGELTAIAVASIHTARENQQ
jgi:four helix bundle protein